MKKLLFTIAVLAAGASLFGQAANDMIVTQRKADNSGSIQRNVPMQGAIGATTASYLSALGLGTEDSPAFTGLTLSGLTATRVPFAGVGGALTDSANLTFNSGTGQLSASSLNLGSGSLTAGAGSFTSLSATVPTGGQALGIISGNTTGVYQRISTSAGTKGFIGTADQIFSGGSVSDLAIDANAGVLQLGAQGSVFASLSTTGLAVTGSLSATGTALIGPGGTGPANGTMVVDGGSGATGGAYLSLRKNSVESAAVGHESVLLGSGTGDALMLWAASGNSIKAYILGTGTVATFTSTGLAVTGNLTGTGVYSTTTASAANVFVDSNGLLQRSTSSLRYKRDVRDYTRGIADVLKLRPVTYKGINDGDKVFAGLIAEEVAEAGLEEFVVRDSEDRPDALHYPQMVALAFAAIKEQDAEVKSLRARVAALEAQQATILSRLRATESK
jgi:hypothetical protein